MLKVSSVATVVAAVIVLLGVTAHAGSFSGAISTTLTSTTSGTCDVNSICPSGDCTCLVYDGTVSGSVGKGTAEVDATEDNGLATTPGCTPFFAEVFLSASKDSDQEIDGVGALCPLSATSANSKLSGGFNITSSDIGATGWGLFTATLTGATNRLVLHYKGTN
jgi:hypothetical protein